MQALAKGSPGRSGHNATPFPIALGGLAPIIACSSSANGKGRDENGAMACHIVFAPYAVGTYRLVHPSIITLWPVTESFQQHYIPISSSAVMD